MAPLYIILARLPDMSLRESLVENFAGDLEYHPRRAVMYLALAIAAGAFWFHCPGDTKFATVPLVFVFGALSLITKGIFLLRRSSEGLGLSQHDFAALSENQKHLPSVPAQAAQVLQDFGAGPL